LLAAGYRPEYEPEFELWYRRRHHHLAPLIVPGGKSLELHVALGPQRGAAGTWARLRPHLSSQANSPHEFVLDAVAQAVHLTLHAETSRRLYDAVLLACMFRDRPMLRDEVAAWLRESAAAPQFAVIWALADELRGVPARAPLVAQHLRWIRRREDLPTWLRTRTQFVDAWYENGGKLFGPATKASVARLRPCERLTPKSVSVVAARTLGRAAMSLAAAAFAAMA
ncbi:MAG: hypothetical protein JO349_09415, partial [Candidatus Eremiobacteraeota bacterium]|nr:hypothetical protein [Candidatus Eremiobacteraeota bacterium]